MNIDLRVTKESLMFSHPFSDAAAAVRLPKAPAPNLSPNTFVVCSAGVLPALSIEQWLWQQWVYQRAYEEALAVLRPSLLERDLLGVWN